MLSDTTTLLSGGTATGQWYIWNGGRGTFAVDCSNFNGATVTLQRKGPNGSALDVGAAATLTANGMANFEMAVGEIRAAVSGATPGAGVYADVIRI